MHWLDCAREEHRAPGSMSAGSEIAFPPVCQRLPGVGANLTQDQSLSKGLPRCSPQSFSSSIITFRYEKVVYCRAANRSWHFSAIGRPALGRRSFRTRFKAQVRDQARHAPLLSNLPSPMMPSVTVVRPKLSGGRPRREGQLIDRWTCGVPLLVGFQSLPLHLMIRTTNDRHAMMESPGRRWQRCGPTPPSATPINANP